MRTIVNAIISFEMVAIPVGIGGVTTTTNDPKFRTLHDPCGTPITKQDLCPVCETGAYETIKGYEVAKNQFLHFTEEELATVSSDKSNVIELSKFVKASDIPALRVAKSYWLIPPENPKLAEKYGLLYQSLAETKKVGLGTETLWGTEHPCVIAPNQNFHAAALQLNIMHLDEDLVEPDFSAPVPGREEKKMAKMIIESLTGEFNPETDLVSGHRQKVQDLISARIDGKDLPTYAPPAAKESEVDLMGALRESVAAIEERNSKQKKKVAAKK